MFLDSHAVFTRHGDDSRWGSSPFLGQKPFRLTALSGDRDPRVCDRALRGGVSGSPVSSSLPIPAMLFLNSLIAFPIEPPISGMRFGPNTSNATAMTIKRCGRLRFSNNFPVLQATAADKTLSGDDLSAAFRSAREECTPVPADENRRTPILADS
jgi:hypothetical protein